MFLDDQSTLFLAFGNVVFFFACQQYWQITTHAFQFDFLKKKNLFIFALDLFFLFNTQRESSVSIYIYIKSEARSSP